MTNSSLKQDPNQLTLYVHPWYEALNEQESITRCEFGLTLKPSEETIGLRSIEWAAGLYEGEGCLYLDTSTNAWRMSMQMTDYDVMREFHATVEVGTLNGPYRRPNQKKEHKSTYMWRTYKQKDVFHLVCEFYPYMGERRRAKFDEFLTTYGN
jgi:hypothetical protein